MGRLLLGLGLSVIVLCCVAPASPGAAQARIVFYSERDGNGEIYVMSPDGTGLERLTTNASNEFCPDWSPDGTRIAYESDRDDAHPVACFPSCIFKVYVMGADGTGEHRLMDLPGSEGHPDWSADGQSLVFQADRDADGKSEIYVVGAEGGEPRLVIGGEFDNTAPDWSPDGTRIAFSSDRDGGLDIFVVSVDGTGLTKVIDTGINDYFPDWSPDGREILFFAADWPTVRQALYVVGADGSNLVSLTTPSRVVNESAQWSPDGERIVFQTDRDRNFEIYSMNRDGTDVRRLTNHRLGDYWPDLWMAAAAEETPAEASSPEAEAADHPIAFVSTRTGRPQIHKMNADGSDPIQLTYGSTESYHPAWSPDGARIAYYVHLTQQSWALVVMNADGSGRQEITHSEGCATCAMGPHWSPDGTKIGFTIEPNPRPTCEIKSTELAMVNADGSACQLLTQNEWNELFCGWSPDGASILYTTNRDGTDQVYVASADLTGERRLTELVSTNRMPAWSPDGARIAFVSNRDGNDEIYIMDDGGMNVTRITSDPSNDWMPTWSPDGAEIVFSSNRNGALDIYAVRLDDLVVRRLTTAAGYDYEAAWRK